MYFFSSPSTLSFSEKGELLGSTMIKFGSGISSSGDDDDDDDDDGPTEKRALISFEGVEWRKLFSSKSTK